MLEEELKKIEVEKCKGAILRSKAKYTIEGEKFTKFFFGLEKRKGRTETIKVLNNRKGEEVKDMNEILKEIKIYYEELFGTKGIDEKEKNELLEYATAKVSKEDKENCDKEISKEEILQAINMLKGKKSPLKPPKIDGLLNEFYKVFKE